MLRRSQLAICKFSIRLHGIGSTGVARLSPGANGFLKAHSDPQIDVL